MGTIDFTDYLYDAQQGDQSAIKFIYDNTIQLFYKEADAIMQDKDEADKAVRDAYIFIFEHLDSLEDPSRFILWANEVCKNTCITKLKQRGVFDGNIPAQAASLTEINPASDYDPLINNSASMLASHAQVCLEAILNTLPEDQRVCAVLWAEGYPIRSIARKLSMDPVAVNYILACTLTNISNAVTTLGKNGLKLFGMEPIPYYLWLLINYYRNYQPDKLTHGSESSFSNILRVLMPEEASVYEADNYNGEYEDPSGRVVHVSDIGSETAGASEADDNDIDFNSFTEGSDGSSEGSADTPPMDVYFAHENEDGTDRNIVDLTAVEGSSTDESKNRKKYTPLLIALLIVCIIALLVALGFIFFKDKMESTFNSIFGSGTAVVQEETTPEPESTTEEPEPETTTAEPETTTAEPETTAEEVAGPEFNVIIYTGDNDSLALKAEPVDWSDRLLYVPDAAELHIDETVDGWGHTTYEGTEGWVWLYYTKVVGKALVEEPANKLDEPTKYTAVNSYLGLELRMGPGTHYSTFGTVPEGTEVTVEGYQEAEGSTWLYVDYDGQYGWLPYIQW